MIGLIIGGVVVLLLIILVSWGIGVYNTLIRLRNNVDEAFSTMDVYMKKRYDLVPNYVETVKGYAKHEKETLEKVISARNVAVNAGTAEEQVKADGELTATLRQLAVVVEQYPNLKADANFKELQSTLTALENDIASSRKYYNGTVKAYNVKREVFPSSIIANWKKFEKKPLYEIENVEHRKNVKVEF